MLDNKQPQTTPTVTKWSIIRDIHACSFNRVKEIRIEQDGNIVILNAFDIEQIARALKDD